MGNDRDFESARKTARSICASQSDLNVRPVRINFSNGDEHATFFVSPAKIAPLFFRFRVAPIEPNPPPQRNAKQRQEQVSSAVLPHNATIVKHISELAPAPPTTHRVFPKHLYRLIIVKERRNEGHGGRCSV